MYIFFIQQPTLEMMSDGFDKEAILAASASLSTSRMNAKEKQCSP